MRGKTEQQGDTRINGKSIRTSVTFPVDLYDALELIAKEKKVSVAWIVRDAAEKYIADQWPLFSGNRQ
jgi:predicted DNA-binding protein